MRRLITTFLIMLVFSGCYKVWWVESEYVDAPNWTPENTVLFLYTVERIKWVENRVTGGRWPDVVEGATYLYEVDTNEVYRRVGKIFGEPKRFSYLSVGGNNIVISVDNGPIYLIKRDLSLIKKIGEGGQADLSPDGRKFVYVKKDQGLWIKNIDGTNDRQIISDPNANHPAWSSDGGRIALKKGSLIIIDTLGNILNSFGGGTDYPDWGPIDSNAISCSGIYDFKGRIIYIQKDTTIILEKIASGWGLRWSPSGSHFIAYDGKWYVIKRDGSKKFYIKP